MSEVFYTPPQAAEILGVSADKVLHWIHAGELVASNLAARPDGDRPRWRIAEDELGKFLIRRRPVVAAPEPRRRRGQSKTTPGVTYFA